MNPESRKFPTSATQLNFPLLLAPMVGLSHIGLRLLVRRYWPTGAKSIWPTEMLNSRRLPNEKLGQTPETFRSPFELDICPQILGNEEKPIYDSIRLLEEWGAIGIDINMGCPVQKALKHNYGVALMGDLDYAARVTNIATRASRLPVSVKLRAGHQNDIEYLSRFVKKLEESGASWLTLHPRTSEQKRRGRADWNQIREVRAQVAIPVIGNGDIQVVDDVERMLSETQCDAVMVGRAMTARPWMAWQLGERLGFPPPESFLGRSAPSGAWEEGEEMGRSLSYFIEVMEEYFPENLGVRKIKFFIRHCHVWLEFGHILFSLSTRAKSYLELKQTIASFFDVPQKMMSYTDLRI
ncbi:MAG: tRNA-dihydrouridine synthase family protein [Bdellovibrionales bacterium]|nr:tRNA-dihydrouridine synthase family protein [Bdellovibrionales bacterium]